MKYLLIVIFFVSALSGCSDDDSDDTIMPIFPPNQATHPTAITWQERSSASSTRAYIRNSRVEEKRAGHTAILTGSIVYVFGGQDENQYHSSILKYNVDTNVWEKLNPAGFLPDARIDHCAAIINNTLYIYGGNDDISIFKDIWAYDIALNTWSQKLDAPIARKESAYCHDNDYMYVLHGLDENDARTGSLWRYACASDSWLELEQKGLTSPFDPSIIEIPKAKSGGSAFYINSAIWHYGGNDGDAIFENHTWEYRIADNYWHKRPRVGYPRQHHVLGTINNRIYIWGGSDHEGALRNDLCELLLSSGTMTTVLGQGQDENREPGPREKQAFIFFGNRIFVFGGIDKNGTYLSDLWECTVVNGF